MFETIRQSALHCAPRSSLGPTTRPVEPQGPLPNDLLYRVFDHLDPASLGRAADTCRHWQAAGRQARFWRTDGEPWRAILPAPARALEDKLPSSTVSAFDGRVAQGLGYAAVVAVALASGAGYYKSFMTARAALAAGFARAVADGWSPERFARWFYGWQCDRATALSLAQGLFGYGALWALPYAHGWMHAYPQWAGTARTFLRTRRDRRDPPLVAGSNDGGTTEAQRRQIRRQHATYVRLRPVYVAAVGAGELGTLRQLHAVGFPVGEDLPDGQAATEAACWGRKFDVAWWLVAQGAPLTHAAARLALAGGAPLGGFVEALEAAEKARLQAIEAAEKARLEAIEAAKKAHLQAIGAAAEEAGLEALEVAEEAGLEALEGAEKAGGFDLRAWVAGLPDDILHGGVLHLDPADPGRSLAAVRALLGHLGERAAPLLNHCWPAPSTVASPLQAAVLASQPPVLIGALIDAGGDVDQPSAVNGTTTRELMQLMPPYAHLLQSLD